VAGRHGIHVEDLAACGAAPVKDAAIPGSESMKLVLPMVRGIGLASLRKRRILSGEGSRRRTRCKLGCGCCVARSGKTRICLHCSRRKQQHQRDQRNGGDTGYDANP